jgi:hypothetical protein
VFDNLKTLDSNDIIKVVYYSKTEVYLMATIEESAVFEYCQKLFDDFEARDGGYYPSRHDKDVYTQASAYFSISEIDISRIFDVYSRQAAEIEMQRINKLPSPIRKKAIEKRARDIMLNNKDLPFYKREGSPNEDLPNALDVLSEEYRTMIEAVAQAGWTIPLSIDIRRFETLKRVFRDRSAIDIFFEDFYVGRELKQICRNISNILGGSAQQTIFDECVKAYENNLYSACLTTLITVLEGFISTFGDDPQDVRVMRVCKFYADEELKKKNNIKSLCWLSIYEFTKSLYEKSDFTQPEPSEVNRHWVLHGRTERTAGKTDCIRVFNALSTLVIVKKSQSYDTSTD